MKRLITTLAIILLVGNTFGQFNKAGRTVMQFLKIGMGARQVGMGETGIASVRDINSIFWNPAAITGINSGEASFSYTKWISDLNILSGAVGYNLSNIGTIAVSYISMDYGDIPEALVTSPTGRLDTRTGSSFTGNDLAVGIGFAKQFTDKLSIGINFKYIREKLYVYTADQWGLDLGSFYNTGWKGISLAMSAQNFSTPARWLHTKEESQQTYDLPLVYKIGVSVDLWGGQDLFLGGDPENQKLTVNIDAIHTNDYAERLHFGAEYTLFNMFSLRGGYRLNYEEGNFSLGAGFKYNKGSLDLRFDYAYVHYTYLSMPHRFSLTIGL